MELLTRFLDFLLPPRKTERVVRELKEETLAELVGPMLIPLPSGEATALLPYRDERVRALILEAKYHKSERAWDFLAQILFDYLLAWVAEEAWGEVVIVPVPLGRERLKERGYNQAEEVARRFALKFLSS